MNRLGHGVVEGFYGPPWSFEARRRVVALLSDVGLETYVHAPKSEPSHRQRWAEPLGEVDLRALADLAAFAESKRVRFVYGVAPQRLFGGRANLSVKRERDLRSPAFEALVARCASLAARGVRSFLLLFDDTWPTLLPRLATFELGRGHALAARELERRLALEIRGASVAIVPAVYFGRPAEMSRGARRYLQALGSEGDALVAWTGPRIFSTYISGRDVDAMTELVGRPPWIWNNAIANDWLPLATGESVRLRARNHLAFGPVGNVAPEAIDKSAGVVINGAREPEATCVALASFAEQKSSAWPLRPEQAMRAGLERVYGSAADTVAILVDAVGGHPLSAAHVGGAHRLAEAIRSVRAGRSGSKEELGVALDSLAGLAAALDVALANHPGQAELAPTARKISDAALALRAAFAGDPAARRLARVAAASPWRTALDDFLLLAERNKLR